MIITNTFTIKDLKLYIARGMLKSSGCPVGMESYMRIASRFLAAHDEEVSTLAIKRHVKLNRRNIYISRRLRNRKRERA